MLKDRKFWVSLLAGIMAAVMILGLIVGILPHASAASSSEIKNQIEELERQNEELEGKIEELKKQNQKG